MSVSNDEFASLASARAGIYDFLASLCAKPYVKSVEALLKYATEVSSTSSLPAGLKSGLRSLSSSSPGTSKGDWETDLQVDWTKLFRGVAKGYGPPPPYEYVYSGGSGNQSTQAVRQTYAQQGLELSPEARESPDYIGVEFKFMSSLATKEAAVWKVDRNQAIKLIAVERRFAEGHTSLWVPRYCEDASKIANTEFYKAAIQLIESVVLWDASLLKSLEATALDSF